MWNQLLTMVDRFPLAEHICNLKTHLRPPSYLESRQFINLSSAFERIEQKRAAKKLNILENWPPAPEDTLDQSQWNALHQMLTTRLSIIQGPPGTGKTHVSVVGLRVLLENKSSSDSPILVAAQTNHALDQILRHISNFDDNYIRLGGRSKNTEIRKHTLYETRKKDNVRPPTGSYFGKATKAQSELARAMAETLSPFIRDGATHPLAPDVLLQLGIITADQADSLVAGATQWVSSSAGEPGDPMSLWLDKQLNPFEVIYERDMFGYEEEEKDAEYEQLKELEAEHGVDDDEDIENLRGMFRVIEDRYICRTTPAHRKQAESYLTKHSDLWDIPERARGGVYCLFQDRAKAAIRERFREQAQRYAKVSQDLQIGKWERDVVLLQKANIVGMTTTGFSKYRPLVASLKPKIILIEEAAEVLEGPVTAVCVESLEHLILVGDHQQLQGHCNVQELEEVFHLNVSMFERLVRNNMPFKTLTRQRRMDPEIRRALAPIYQDLEDHSSVVGRPPVPGMGPVRSFFFDHNWSEGSDSMLSKYNEQEAEFVVGFFCYLVRGGIVPPHGITVLTFYNGQRKVILKLLKQQEFLAGEYLSVNTVDSYQGEENAIVLLSLVRSNEQGNIGFLEVTNRVCVALSRARLGFYIFGNATQLSKDPLWDQVIAIMGNNPNRVGSRFPIECLKHNRKSEIQYPRDWNGRFGCNQKCAESLDCGHRCPLTCHSFSHQIVVCKARCQRSLICGHPCGMECSQQCYCRSKCADFARLSENPEWATDGSLVGSYNLSRDTGDWEVVGQKLAGSVPSMEVRGNNSTENNSAIRPGPMTAAVPVAIKPRTRSSPPNTSSSSTATSEPFRRMSPEKQLQSRTNWGAFANGGAKNDDLLRDKGAMQQKQRLVEQRMDLLGLHDDLLEDPATGKENFVPLKQERQRALKNGRVRHDHDYVPSNANHPGGTYDGAANMGTQSGKGGGEVMNLIDID
jgi:helicase required for RNAi-mediated heterochromatin assembly 1